MTREIKFRALVSDWNGNKKFVYYKTNELIENSLTDSDKEILVQDSQYTGLKDKNGKEIYEGDIINEYDCNCGHPEKTQTLLNTGKIEWCPGGWVDMAYAILYTNRTSRILQLDDEPHYEVLGNVYENPELLTSNNNVQIEG